MAPTLAPGDLLLASRRRPPVAGAIAVLDGPDGLVLVKRLVAGPGSEVVLTDGVLTVDGVPWPSILDIPGSGTWTIPSDHWFALSDAPERTDADSRSFGPVPTGVVRGIVAGRLWPNPGLIG